MRLFEIVAQITSDPGRLEQGGVAAGAFPRRALKFAQQNVTMRCVFNDSGGDPVETNEAKPAENPFGADDPGQGLYIPKTVLQGDDGSIRTQERRQ
jgi:hypothetical protein